MSRTPPAEVSRWITPNDLNRSRTTWNLGDLRNSLAPLRDVGVRRMLDVGCGFGGLSRVVAEWLGAEEVHGVDIDEAVLAEAISKGVRAIQHDVASSSLPYSDEYFDLVITLGMMDYLPTFDGMIREMSRVTRPDGHVLIALPNLGSWQNRTMLLLGYQPRDVEISSETVVGVPPHYRNGLPTGHIHTATVKAFTELMLFHGFEAVKVSPGRPTMNRVNPLLDAVDRALTRWPSLARRFYYLGRKRSAS
jgi:methionine biosynthesis protein MetW